MQDAFNMKCQHRGAISRHVGLHGQASKFYVRSFNILEGQCHTKYTVAHAMLLQYFDRAILYVCKDGRQLLYYTPEYGMF